jgi:hypothetical protein
MAQNSVQKKAGGAGGTTKAVADGVLLIMPVIVGLVAGKAAVEGRTG